MRGTTQRVMSILGREREWVMSPAVTSPPAVSLLDLTSDMPGSELGPA